MTFEYLRDYLGFPGCDSRTKNSADRVLYNCPVVSTATVVRLDFKPVGHILPVTLRQATDNRLPRSPAT